MSMTHYNCLAIRLLKTLFKIKSHSYLKSRCSMEKNWLNEGGNKTMYLRLFGMRSSICI